MLQNEMWCLTGSVLLLVVVLTLLLGRQRDKQGIAIQNAVAHQGLPIEQEPPREQADMEDAQALHTLSQITAPQRRSILRPWPTQVRAVCNSSASLTTAVMQNLQPVSFVRRIKQIDLQMSCAA